MAPFASMSEDSTEALKNEKRDFSSIIDFIGVNDNSKIKKRRRGDAEKKRRDRINKCLDQLEDLIPYVKQKKLCSKVDKAEVLELTVKFIKESIFHRETNFFPHTNLPMMSYEYKHWNDMRKYQPASRWPAERLTIDQHTKTELCRCGCGRTGESQSIHPPLKNNEKHSRILMPTRGISPQSSSTHSYSSLSPERLSPESMQISSSPTPSLQTSSPITHKIDYLLKSYEKREY